MLPLTILLERESERGRERFLGALKKLLGR